MELKERGGAEKELRGERRKEAGRSLKRKALLLREN